MTAEEFATQLERLIAQARASGIPDDAIIAGLEEAIDAIEEGQS
jgi:DNA-binding transcriptional regulator YhcF (GntR family)